MEQNEKARYKKWFPFTTYDLDELNNRDIVFCFHHAGGSASVYRKWTLKKEKINFVCVELPGKGTRRKERFIENFEELVGPLVESIINVADDRNILFFGHSMGAAMAFYAAAYMAQNYGRERFEFGNEKDREEKREQWSHCVFDLCKWPLYNIRISYVNKAFPRIHIDFDCIIMDAWSAKMMIAKIFEVYEGKIVKWGTYSFKQYCLEQKEYRETHPENAAYSYWRKRVTELPPAPDLPYKKKLSELCGHRFDRISQKFSREETSALYKLVKDNRVTPAALICTMYMKTLMQYSKNKEFSLNLTLFNRLPLSEEIYNLIGDFTNIGAIAYRQQKDFWQEVNFVQKQLWELVRYHSFDGTQILKMIDPMNRGKAILPVVFTGVLQGDRKTKGFLPNGISEGYAISQTPQVVLDYQATDFNGELLVNWDYVIDDMFMTQVGKFSKAELLKKYKKQNCPEVNS